MILCDTCFTLHDRHVKAVWRVWVNDRHVGEACGEHLEEFLRGNLPRISRDRLVDGFHVRPLWAQTGE